MKLSRRERLKEYIGTIFLGSIFIGCMGMFFLLFPLLSEPDYYKNLILLQLNQQAGLSFDFEDSKPTFFPFPGIELIGVSVSKNQEEIIHVRKVKIEIYFGIFIGRDLEIRRVYFNTGKLDLKRDKDESFPILAKFFTKKNPDVEASDSKTKREQILTFENVFGNLPGGLELKNITIVFDDLLYKRNITLYLANSHIEFDKKGNGISLSLYGKLDEEVIQLYSNIEFINKEITYENLRMEGSLHLTNFSGDYLRDISVIFPNADFRAGHLSAVVPFHKRTENVVVAKFTHANIKDVARKGFKPFGDAYIDVTISYDIETAKLSFDDISAEWKGKIKIFGSGYITFIKPPLSPNIYFTGGSDYLDADSVINIIRIFLDPELENSIFTRDMPDTRYVDRMYVQLDFNMKKVNLRSLFANDLSFSLYYHNNELKIKKLDTHLYGGILKSTGVYYFGKSPRLSIVGRSENVKIEDFLKHQFNLSPITGILETNFTLDSQGLSENAIVHTIKIKANFISQDGELLNYTNILKPISSIGNLLSLKKLDFSRSTPYKEIKVDLEYFDRKFQFSNFILKADGLSGRGGGSIDLDKKIDMKFTIALPGLTGKALKLPIIYKGTYGISNPYIDPIWLGSVYAGTILLAGPAGAAVGGIAGSALSEYVHRVVDSVTDTVEHGWRGAKNRFTKIFGSDEPKEQKEENKNTQQLEGKKN